MDSHRERSSTAPSDRVFINTLDSAWKTVLDWHHRPQLPPPQLVDQVEGGAEFRLGTSRTHIGRDTILEIINQSELSPMSVIEGLLTHEVGHYMTFPRNLRTVILANKIIEDYSSGEPEPIQDFIFQTYADVANDVKSVLSEPQRSAILDVRAAILKTESEPEKTIRELILAYLRYQAGQEYTDIIPDGHEEHFERMQRIDFLDRGVDALRVGLWHWAEIVTDILDSLDFDRSSERDGTALADINTDDLLSTASSEDIRNAMGNIADEVTRREYEQIENWLDDREVDTKGVDELVGEQVTEQEDSGEIGIGTGEGQLTLDSEIIRYYRRLSREYPLAIRRKPIETESTRETFEDVSKWRVNEDALLAMPEHSGGKLLPGVTRQIVRRERPQTTIDHEIPHLLVAIDSSGSMPDPAERKSYAVLAAVSAARSYRLHESAVGVINFSGKSYYLPYTYDIDQAMAAICAYQGGGTVVDMELLEEMLGPEEASRYNNSNQSIDNIPDRFVEKDVEVSEQTFRKALQEDTIDLLMFTDGGIANLDAVVEELEARRALNRGTLILTGRHEQFVPETERIRAHRVDDEADIHDIVVEDVRQNLKMGASLDE